MPIHLSDKHGANHFCLQAFLSEQSFPILSMSCSSFAVILLFFKVSLDIHSGIFLPVGLVHDINYFPRQIFSWYLFSQKRC